MTGAGQGIGRAVALALGGAGWSVAVSDVRAEATEEVAAALTAAGVKARAVPADVTDEAAVEALGTAAEELGDIGVWVNNAGVTRPAMLHKMTLEDFDLVMAVHARGTFLGIREAARRMIASGTRGCVLNVTSSAGLQGTIGQVNYAGAKGAITAMTQSAARELARHAIRVNAVAPLAATPMTEKLRTDDKLADRYLAQIPLGRWGEPDEIAATFRFLASGDASYITGQVVCVDGGLYMAS